MQCFSTSIQFAVCVCVRLQLIALNVYRHIAHTLISMQFEAARSLDHYVVGWLITMGNFFVQRTKHCSYHKCLEFA